MRRRKMPHDGRNRLQSNVNTAMSRCHPAAQSNVRLAHAMALEFCGQSRLGCSAQRQHLQRVNLGTCR
jgi:hypothetical protein